MGIFTEIKSDEWGYSQTTQNKKLESIPPRFYMLAQKTESGLKYIPFSVFERLGELYGTSKEFLFKTPTEAKAARYTFLRYSDLDSDDVLIMSVEPFWESGKPWPTLP